MKIEKGKIYWCKTEELAKEFLKEAEKQGLKWAGCVEPTSMNFWGVCKDKTCYRTLDGHYLSCYNKKYYDDNYPDIPIIEYKTTPQPVSIKSVTLQNGVTTVELTDGRKG